MKRFQLLLIAVGVVILGLVFAEPVKATIASQQAQIGVTVVVPVTGTPIAYVPHQASGQSGIVVSSLALRETLPSLQRTFRAESLQFDSGSSMVVAQAQVQHGVLVQAEVTPNPKATILYSNNPSYTFNPVAPGSTTQTTGCAFTVTVDMTSTFSLEQGVAASFSGNFPGTDLANNTYITTPQPTSTPYVNYATDGSEWSLLGTGTAKTVYCIQLTVTVPPGVTDGTYTTNVIYTLFN